MRYYCHGPTRDSHQKHRLQGAHHPRESFANRTMLVERHGDEIVLRLARVIPESEAWLYENPKALKLVRRGLDQASKHEFSQGPDMAAAAKLAGEIQDD